MKQIKIRIFPDGQVHAETNGVKGKSCTDYIGIIEKLLNAQVIESAFTGEYHENHTQEVSETTIQQNND